MLKILIGFVLLLLLPRAGGADILGIGEANRRRSTTTTRSAGQGTAFGQDVHSYNSTRPGRACAFDFSFEKSSEKFNWKINVVVAKKIPREAGHNHEGALPELFYFPNWPDRTKIARLDNVTVQSPMLDQDQTFSVHLTTVNYAVQLTAYGAYTSLYHGETLHPTLTEDLDIKAPGLEELPKNEAFYKLEGWTLTHPYNHYGTTTTLAGLKSLASAWKKHSPGSQLLEFGNISLPWGGTIDPKNDGKAKSLAHAYGIAADVGKQNYTNDERARLIKLMCGSGFEVYNTDEGMKAHYHLVHKSELVLLKARKLPADFKGEDTDTPIACCTVSPADYQKCVGI